MVLKRDLSSDRTPNGHYNIQTRVAGDLVKQQYIGYPKRQAVTMFLDRVNNRN